MKIQATLLLQNVYGGDNLVRMVEREKIAIQRKVTLEEIRESAISYVGMDSKTQQKKVTTVEPVLTFRTSNGKPVLRLGGSHGKLWGALKGAAQRLRAIGEPQFRAYSAILEMITVTPEFVELEVKGTLRIENLPQELQGGGGMIHQMFDVIPEATATVELTFPEQIKPQVKLLLKQVELAPALNKRRATIRVLSIGGM